MSFEYNCKKEHDPSVFVVYPTEYKPITYIQDYLIYNSSSSTYLLSNPFYELPSVGTANTFKHPSDIVDKNKTKTQPAYDPFSATSSDTTPSANSILDTDDFENIFGISAHETTSIKLNGGSVKTPSSTPSSAESSKFNPPSLALIQSDEFTSLTAPQLYFNRAPNNISSNFTIAYGILDDNKRLTKKEYVLRAPFDFKSVTKSSVKCSLSPGDIHKIDMYILLLEHQTLFVTELLYIALLFQIDLPSITNSSYRSSAFHLANNEFVTTLIAEVNRKLQQISPSLTPISISDKYLNSFVNPPSYTRTSNSIIRAETTNDATDCFLTPLEQLSNSLIALHYSTDRDVRTLAKRIHNSSLSYIPSYTLSLPEFQNIWITFYGNVLQRANLLRPNSRLVLYNKQNAITGNTSSGKWLTIPVTFNTKLSKSSSKRPTLRHISAEKLETVTTKTIAELFRINLSQPELYNNRKYYFGEGCIYLRPKLRLMYNTNCYPCIVWNVEKYILVKQKKNTSRVYNDIEVISGLFNDSPKLANLK